MCSGKWAAYAAAAVAEGRNEEGGNGAFFKPTLGSDFALVNLQSGFFFEQEGEGEEEAMNYA